MMRRLLGYLTSTRLTLCLILLLGTMFLLGLWIPQKGLLKKDLYLQWQAASPGVVSVLDALGLTQIYTSPVTLTLWSLFFLNLALVMWQRIPVVRKRIAFGKEKLEEPASPAYPYKASLEIGGGMSENLRVVFRQAGYSFHGVPSGFYAVKNRLSPVATLLFHLSFFLILLGGAISGYTKFAGTLELAEGESFHGELERYSASPRLPKVGTPPKISFTIRSIKPEVSGETSTGLAVTLLDDRGEMHKVEVNRPYKRDRTSLVIKNLGVAPLFVVHDKSGRELDGAFTKLDVLRGKQDVFAIMGYSFSALFYPDHFMEKGVDGTRSAEFRNPAFHLKIEKNGVPVAEKSIGLNQSVEFDGYRLSFANLSYWVSFFVVKEHGLGVIYTGFAVATIALIWRLLFFRREIVGSVREEQGKCRLQLAGRSEFYKALSEEEFEETVARIASKLKATGS